MTFDYTRLAMWLSAPIQGSGGAPIRCGTIAKITLGRAAYLLFEAEVSKRCLYPSNEYGFFDRIDVVTHNGYKVRFVPEPP